MSVAQTYGISYRTKMFRVMGLFKVLTLNMSSSNSNAQQTTLIRKHVQAVSVLGCNNVRPYRFIFCFIGGD